MKIKEKCRYKDSNGYCKHKGNQEHGRPSMRCIESGCPYRSKNES